MEPKFAALILAYISAVMASPIEKESNTTSVEYVEYYRENAKFSNGHLIWYGTASDKDRSNASLGSNSSPGDTFQSEVLQRSDSCTIAGNPPVCDSSNAARNNECDALVTELNGDVSTFVPESPRQICYLGDVTSNAYCCVSWHNAVQQKLTKGDLAAPANKILTQCTQNGISGKIKSIWLKSTCTDVCLSNRGTHC